MAETAQANVESPEHRRIDLRALYAESNVDALLRELDAELVGLAPVKQRIREIASFLLVTRARERLGFSSGTPTLHMAFTGNPGTGKTTVALRMAGILHRLGYLRKGHLVCVTRDDLVGQYIGHTAPKTREVLKRAMGGVLFIDEAYYLHRPENERDYGQEAIEILLQVMENQRDDLTVILAGYPERMKTFFESNPGFRSRIAHHIDFPDYGDTELLAIFEKLASEAQYRLSPCAREALAEYVTLRRGQPSFSNARSLRNAFDRARLRQAMRLVKHPGEITGDALMTLEAPDIRASRVFAVARSPETSSEPTTHDAPSSPEAAPRGASHTTGSGESPPGEPARAAGNDRRPADYRSPVRSGPDHAASGTPTNDRAGRQQ